MDKQYGVSIIIPVYNSSKFLDQLFQSLNGLNGDNIEIIFVDDSSEDNSKYMIESFIPSSKHQAKLYTKEHSGLNPTRKYGLSKSFYDYVMFLDADDYVSSNYVTDSVEIVKKVKNIDIVSTPIYRINENGSNLEILNKYPDCIKNILNKKEALIELLKTEIIGNYYPGKLFKKELLNIDMDDGRPFEDVRTMHNVFLKANYVYLNDKPSYYYVRHTNTLSNNGKKTLLYKLDALISRYYDLINSSIYDPEIERAISYRIIDAMIDVAQVYHIRNVKKQYQLARNLYKSNRHYLTSNYSYIKRHKLLFMFSLLYSLLIAINNFKKK